MRYEHYCTSPILGCFIGLLSSHVALFMIPGIFLKPAREYVFGTKLTAKHSCMRQVSNPEYIPKFLANLFSSST